MDTINISQDQNQQTPTPPQFEPPKPEGKFKRLITWIKAHKIKTAIIAVLLLAALGLIGFLYWKNHQPIDSPEKLASKQKTTAPSPLTGVEVPKELAARPVTGFIVENSPEARPQSGLQEAGVVYEAVAEGGITRFLALYQEARPGLVGPVRSVRPYYVDWAAAYNAGLGHVGGSFDGITHLKDVGIPDLDQFRFSKHYWRAGDRPAPHNVYTNADNYDALNKDLGLVSTDFNPYPRKKDEPANPPTATIISMDFSGPLFAAQFQYDQANNRYNRSQAGAPHIDRETGQQLHVKNLVVINMPTTYAGKYAQMPSSGTGTAVVFRDGTAIKATWSKPNPKDMLVLKAEDGKDIALNRGNTWFAVVPVGNTLTY